MDILSLSLGPNSPPGGSTSTFLNVLDIALLNAVKANVLVVQAAGNGGPYAKTVTSFSPWVLSVAAGQDDRTFPNPLTLGDKRIIRGLGISRKSNLNIFYEYGTMGSPDDILKFGRPRFAYDVYPNAYPFSSFFLSLDLRRGLLREHELKCCAC